METKGALLWGPGQSWSVEDITISDPLPPEVTVKLAACGICHTDEHLASGDHAVPHWPILGGHEAAGEIVAIGSGITDYRVGDRVVLSALPSCGKCRPCQLGYGALCDEGYRAVSGEAIADNTRRIRARGHEVSAFCSIGGLAPYVTVHEYSVVKLESDMSLELASLLGCGVTTGWGAAVNVAEVRAGDTCVIFGLGGVGASAVLGCVASGAERVVVIDPAASKEVHARGLGATHFFTDPNEAFEVIREETWARMADKVLITVGRMTGDLLQVAVGMAGKLGVIVPVSAGDFAAVDVKLDVNQLRTYMKTIKGALQSGRAPKNDIATLVRLYDAGKLPLEKLVTARYSLDEVNQGYQDMRDARNIRGLVVFDS